MMRSLYTGVSGLKKHQIRMDVIANNIANVNTTAFKASRVSFQDILYQTLQTAQSPAAVRGGINPQQIGIGLGIGSIDKLMTQGALESTGKKTDVAIQGDGFFIVSPDEKLQLFTRDGNFAIDANKYFVDAATGYYVMGWQVGNNLTNPDPFAIDTSLPVTKIELPLGVKKMAKATENIKYASNLNAAANVRQPNFATMRVRPRNSTDWQTVAFKFTEIIDVENGHRWEWYAQVISGGGMIAGSTTGSLVFNDAGEVIENTQPTLIVKDAEGNQVKLFIAPDYNPTAADVLTHTNAVEWTATPVAPNTHRIYDIDDANNDRNMIVAVDPADIAAGADGIPLQAIFAHQNNWKEGGWENDLVIVPEWRINIADPAGVAPDDIHTHYIRLNWFKGTAPGDSTDTGIQNEQNVKDPNDTTTSDIAHRTDPDYWVYKLDLFRVDRSDGSVYADALNPANFGPGGVRLEYNPDGTGWQNVADNRQISRSLIFSDTGYIAGGDGTIDRVQFQIDWEAAGLQRVFNPPATNTGPEQLTFSLTSGSDANLTGEFIPGEVYRNSVQVYDSLGQPHNLTLRFSKAGVNVWDIVASLPENDFAEDSLSGNYMNLTFNTSGQRGVVTWENPPNDPLTPSAITFLPAGANTVRINPDFSQATQFEGEATLKAISQDGYPMGVLQTFVIEESGAIKGVYDNGMHIDEAKIALARFPNPEGLQQIGNNLYNQTPNSGQISINEGGKDGFGRVIAGALEMSNVDLSEEFTNMIITQRGFQANTRIIMTADEMLTDVIELKR